MDPYKILGIAHDASPEEAKKAYRRLAHQYHPDKNQGNAEAEAKFKEINEAWDRIQNPDKYQKQNPFSSYGHGFDINLKDIFSQFSGFGFSDFTQAHSNKKKIYNVALRYSFEEAALGKSKNVVYEKNISCSKCNGIGADSTNGYVNCHTCNGRGMIEKKTKFFGVEFSTCPTCRGRKIKIINACSSCNGSGNVHHTETFEFTPRHGMFNDGQLVQVTDSAGDIVRITLVVEQHNRFTKANGDILSTCELTLKQALMGCSIPVQTIHGEVVVKIKPLTNPGTNIRLQGKGAKMAESQYGNHILKTKVNFPKEITEEQRKKLQEVMDDIYSQ